MELKIQVSQMATGSETVMKDTHFLKQPNLCKGCFPFVIYIPCYSLQCSTLISFFKVLTDLQAKLFLNSQLLLTSSHHLVLMGLQPPSELYHFRFSMMKEREHSGQDHPSLEFLLYGCQSNLHTLSQSCGKSAVTP